MNPFIQAFDELIEQRGINEDEESELIEYIFIESEYTNSEKFSRQNITQDDAEAIALSDRYFIEQCIEQASTEQLIAALNQQPEKLAYHLVYNDTASAEFAVKLLDELLYYRSMGRI